MKNAVFLEEINVDENEELHLGVIQEELEKRAVKSVSLEEIQTAYDKHRDTKKLFAPRQSALSCFAGKKSSNETWAIFLLNYKMANVKLPFKVSKYLETTVFSVVKMEIIIKEIKNKRREHLGIEVKSKIPISERELLAYYDQKLPAFYQTVIEGPGKYWVHSQLIPKKPIINLKSNQVGGSKVTQNKTKVKVVLAASKKSPEKMKLVTTQAPKQLGKSIKNTIADAAVESSTSTSTITPHFSLAKTSNLRAEVLKTLTGSELARNPGVRLQQNARR